MSNVISTILWAILVGVCVLPALSNTGYLPLTFEYLLAVLCSVVLGVVLALMSRVRHINIVLLLGLTAFSVALYFGHYFVRSPSLFAAAFIIGSGLAVWAHKHFNNALFAVAFVAFSQIVTAAFMTSSYVVRLKEKPVVRSNMPAIVHITLDEHGTMAALPQELISKNKQDAFLREYVRQGFIVFSHAYTADMWTRQSLPRLFNVNNTQPTNKKLITRRAGKLAQPNTQAFKVKEATVFDEIGKKRAIDISQVEYLNFDHALRYNPAVARNLTYNVRALGDRLQAVSLKNRVTIAHALVVEWFKKGVRSPFAKWLFPKLGIMKKIPAPHAVSAHLTLRHLIDRLACCGQRGTYYYAHLLLPHDPYVLDKECNLRPVRKWVHNDAKRIYGKRRVRKAYRRYYAQVLCAKKEMMRLVDAVGSNHNLADTVIFVHSDHGDRIQKKGSNARRSMYGAFMAVKIPGMEGRIINTPVRVDLFYKSLLENDFQSFSIDAPESMPGSPF